MLFSLNTYLLNDKLVDMNKLIILSGVPGSGKSYFSNTIKKIKNSHVYIVSSDQLRKEITGSQSNLYAEDLMWKMFYSLAKTYSLDKDGIVILDATHVSSYLRVDKNLELKPLFDQTILVMWNTDRQLVSNQNLQREYPIPPEALDKFFSIFELPTDKDREFFDKILMVTNNDIAPIIEELDLGLSKDMPQ